MRLEQVNLEQIAMVKKNCLYISNRENKAVTRNKELYPADAILQSKGHNKLYFDLVDMGSNQKNFNLYIDYNFICYDLHIAFYESAEIDEVKNRLNISAKQLEYTYMKNLIIKAMNDSKFINVAEIKLLELSEESPELIKQLIKAREEFFKNKKIEEQKIYNKKLQKVKLEYAERLTKFNDEILKAEQLILKKEKVNSKEIEYPEMDDIYISRYNKDLFLELFKKYSIKVPLKTQGWIKNALADIHWDQYSNSYSYGYYTSSKNSTVFMDYLHKLITAINKAYDKYVEESDSESGFGFEGYVEY